MYKRVNLIVDNLQASDDFPNIVEHLRAHYKIEPAIFSSKEVFAQESEGVLCLLYLDDEAIKHFFKNHLNTAHHVGILPTKSAPLSIKKFALAKDIFEAIDDAFNDELLSRVDLLLCNEYVAFNRITVGSMRGLNQVELLETSKLKKVRLFFENLKNITFTKYTLTTSKEQKIETVASGITIIENEATSEKAAISGELSIHDGKLNAFILAPTSLLSYLWYLISLFIYQKISLLALPKSLGFIKTSKLTVGSDKPIDYILDGNLLSAKELELVSLQDAITLHLGKKLKEHIRFEERPIEEKDSIKIGSLPVGEVNTLLMSNKLPLFKKASEEEFKEVFLSLRNSAKFSFVFATLMVLSTLLATTGLFGNSAPVIIGAMILAPLMAPIVSLAMGVVRAEKVLLTQSLQTLAFGILTALACSYLFTSFITLEQITPEMQSRLNPNILDLMVAIFSGIAGAYAAAKEEVAKSLAGVAIAVALVPPLSVTGIGIGLGNPDVIYGSFLLFSANLVGMTLSGALTFIVLGFSPVNRAKKGLLYTAALLAIVTIPLTLSFYEMKKQNDYMQRLEQVQTMQIGEKKLEISVKSIDDTKEALVVNIETLSSTTLSNGDFDAIKEALRKQVDKEIILEVTPRIKVN
ncbi:MAG: TIGR00341 family protein [Thiovulaceae bacterium]|nr:TIGR00341 family protein [Sulfurimonadaceae bacterium]